MNLFKLKIEGFRKIKEAEVCFGQSTFLVGANNTGKSTVLKAIDILLNSEQKQKLNPSEFLSYEHNGEKKILNPVIIITGEFRDVPAEYNEIKGYKGRLIPYLADGKTGLSIVFRKTFEPNKDVVIELKSRKRSLKKNLVKVEDYLKCGVTLEELSELLGKVDLQEESPITAAQQKKLLEIDEIYDFNEGEEWIKNPGGFLSVFASRLPRYIEIPALHSYDDLSGKNGAMLGILNALFDEVKVQSENYGKASEYLTKLAAELDPKEEDREFGKLMKELNAGFGGVFPGATLNISVNLSEPDKSIIPSFVIEASSNIKTPLQNQGTGLSRSALFNLLKFKAEWSERNAAKEKKSTRKIIIGFEEPELYLHPAAQILIRDFIYELAESSSMQIISSTHSAHMIDVSREKIKQVINHLSLIQISEEDLKYETVTGRAFNTYEAFKNLQVDDKEYVKMLMRVDETFSRAFFTEKCVLFEGDSEQIAFYETFKRFDPARKKKTLNKYALISARGKGTLIPLIKYCKAVGLNIIVLHDSDESTPKAKELNEPIRKALGDDSNLFLLKECIEDVIGINRATTEKPYKIFKHIDSTWEDKFEGLPENWKDLINKVFVI